LKTGWKAEKVDFDSTVFVPHDTTPPDPISKCLANSAHAQFSNIAGVEYQDTDHVGTLYGGFQSDGTFMQWPGIEWCPTTYDPRFRPWYAASTTNPKIIILVIDCSGSMAGSRMILAKSAAKAVVKTLTWVDQIGFVLFNGNVKSSRAPVYLSTESDIDAVNKYIDDNFIASGYTTFLKPLTEAIAFINNAPATCTRAILFLTDGIASFTESDYETIKASAATSDINIFTFALGRGADVSVTQRLACENRAIAYTLSDGASLGEVMSSYYTFFAASMTHPGSRWVLYNDFATGTELLSACTPVYDRSDPSKKYSLLAGVVCMDMNILVSISDLRQRTGWGNLYARVKAASDSCTPPWTGFNAKQIEDTIEQLRVVSVPNGGLTCAVAGGDDGADGADGGMLWGIISGVMLIVGIIFSYERLRTCYIKTKVHVGTDEPGEVPYHPHYQVQQAPAPIMNITISNVNENKNEKQ
jgi:hypothetical protein